MKSSTVIFWVISALILIVPGIGQSDSTVNLMSDSESVFADSIIASLNDVNPDAANNENNMTANNVTAPDPEFVDVSTIDVSGIFSEMIFEEADVAEEVDVADVEPATAADDETFPELVDRRVLVTSSIADFLEIPHVVERPYTKGQMMGGAEVDPLVDDETLPELVDRRVLVTSSIADFLEIPYVVERPYTKGQMMS